MNILFLTLEKIRLLTQRGMYMDLMDEFADNGHNVFIATPIEHKEKTKSICLSKNNVHLLGIHIGDYFDTNIVKKGLTLVGLERAYLHQIINEWGGVHFDLVLYSTPPITFSKVIKYFKKKDKAYSYLMLKDIFPQNAVDLGMMSIKGPNSIIYHFFRRKEKYLYNISDTIGCMSPANCEYVLKHNQYIPYSKVEICPNSMKLDKKEKAEPETIRNKYSIPLGKTVFIYGGNIGKPQGVDFILECIKGNENLQNSFILVVGKGSEYTKVYDWFIENHPKNSKLISYLPQEEFDMVVASSDVGLIFLDNKFTIPNFPSRLLSYMEYGLPVLAATDINSDIGKIIVDNGFGWWCRSDNVNQFLSLIETAVAQEKTEMRKNELVYLHKKFSVDVTYKAIMNHFQKNLES
jgi:hypothetical protein